MSNTMLVEVSREFLDDHISQPMKQVRMIKEQFTNQLFNLNWERAKETEYYRMDDQSSIHLQSHTTQLYWQTHNKIEQCEKEMRTIIEELNELENRFHWRSNLHQERFHFLTKDGDLLQKIILLMDIYK